MKKRLLLGILLGFSITFALLGSLFFIPTQKVLAKDCPRVSDEFSTQEYQKWCEDRKENWDGCYCRKKTDYKIQLNIWVPGLTGDQTTKTLSGGLPEYIKGLYVFFVSASVIVGLAFIIIGGFQWLASGGRSDTISKAKERISNAIIGVLLALFSYSILYFINPELVKLSAAETILIPQSKLDLGYPPEIQEALTWFEHNKDQSQETNGNIIAMKQVWTTEGLSNIQKIWEVPELKDTVQCSSTTIEKEGSFCGIHKNAIPSLINIAKYVKEKSGKKLIVQKSSFRSYAQQVYFYYCYKTQKCNSGNKAAYPGTSLHGQGLALDVSTENTVASGPTWDDNFKDNKINIPLLLTRKAFYTKGEGKWKRLCTYNTTDEYWHYSFVPNGNQTDTCKNDINDYSSTVQDYYNNKL